MPTKTTARRPDQYIGEQVEKARKSRGWRQIDLVNRLHELGATHWRQTKITKIERGQTKRIALADTLELAAALGVKPAGLMTPNEGDVELTPKLRRDGLRFKQWLSGNEPLFPEDKRNYEAGALVSDAEWLHFVSTLSSAQGMSDEEKRRNAKALAANRRQLEADALGSGGPLDAS
jgi:transcriptional regulator with XRE-family HTH domain